MLRIIKKIKWIIKKKSFKSIGNIFIIGKNFICKGSENIEIGDNFYAGNNVKLMTWKEYNNKSTGYNPVMKIGNNVSINENCFISCVNRITIGDGVLMGDNVFITDNYHGNNSMSEINTIPLNRKLYSKGPVTIGENVWIGRNVCIMPNVKIGNNVVIGANSVVTHDFENNTIIAGIPAKIIKNIGEEK